MKRIIFASFILTGVIGIEASHAAETCDQCVSTNGHTITECTNNWLLSPDECKDIICPQCQLATNSKLKKQ